MHANVACVSFLLGLHILYVIELFTNCVAEMENDGECLAAFFRVFKRNGWMGTYTATEYVRPFKCNANRYDMRWPLHIKCGDTFRESSSYDWAARVMLGLVPNIRNEHTVHLMKCTCPTMAAAAAAVVWPFFYDAKRYQNNDDNEI